VFENNSQKEKCYMLPEDGAIAKKDMLSLFDAPNLSKVYIKAYAFNMDDLLQKIKDVDSKGVKVYILADFVQARGRGSWEEIVNLHKSLKNGQILLTTAGINSRLPSTIWHSKAMTFIFSDKDPINLDGSCNFSDSGIDQGNTIRIFTSKTYSDNFVQHFNAHRDWTIKNAQHKQIDYLLKNPINTESVDLDEDNAEIFHNMHQLKIKNTNLRLSTHLLAIIIFLQWPIMSTPVCR
jgi:hypothetical protein